MSNSAEHALNFFAPDYFAARAGFIAQARERGAIIETHALDARGAAGEALSIDTAYLGAARPKHLLIVVSGTHGIEAFAGSALQRQWLAAAAPSSHLIDVGVLLIHALNPYGFAWLRRANEHNVDLNRNALEKFPGPVNAPYRALDAWLNPPSAPPVLDASFLPRAAWLRLRHGAAVMQQAIVEGQYEFSRGLFYGGTAMEASTRVLFDTLAAPRWDVTERLLLVDVHTGVGRRGTYKLMFDFGEGSEPYREMENCFGAATVVSNRPTDSLAYRVSGGLTELVLARFAPRRAYPCVLEFGTVGPSRTLARLRAENRAYHFDSPGSAAHQRAQARLRAAFCPNSARWRAGVLHQGAQVLTQALTWLSASRGANVR